MSITQKDSVFTVSTDMIPVDKVLPYDLYINSSGREGYERFVCVFRHGRQLTELELHEIKKRFTHLYVREAERGIFLKTFTDKKDIPQEQRTMVVKESAIKHLGDIFSKDKELTSEVLNESLHGCKDSVESMVNLIKADDVDKVQELIAKLSFHDFYTFDHSINVAMYCISIYRMIKKDATDQELIVAGLGGLLHDIGKIKIPTNIINSPYKLRDDEYHMIRQHPGWGNELIAQPDVSTHGTPKQIIQQVIYQHHENFDGSGYPNGLAGEDIHVLARLTSMSDFFDAITTKRSYHEVMNPEEALNLMKNSVGKKLDPKLYKLFSHHMINHKDCQIEDGYDRCIHATFDPCQPRIVAPWEIPDDPVDNTSTIVHQDLKKSA